MHHSAADKQAALPSNAPKIQKSKYKSVLKATEWFFCLEELRQSNQISMSLLEQTEQDVVENALLVFYLCFNFIRSL